MGPGMASGLVFMFYSAYREHLKGNCPVPGRGLPWPNWCPAGPLKRRPFLHHTGWGCCPPGPYFRAGYLVAGVVGGRPSCCRSRVPRVQGIKGTHLLAFFFSCISLSDRSSEAHSLLCIIWLFPFFAESLLCKDINARS